MKCNYVLTDSTDPYRNLAVEYSLMEYVSEGGYILFLWQNAHTIVIGRNQDPFAECRAEEFLKTNGRIARRRSGGGAVYHDLGNLNFSILSLEREKDQVSYQSLVGRAMKQIGLEILYNGRNDLTYQGRKFSGNAAYEEDGRLCQHGTIMVRTDVAKMDQFLTPEQSKLDRNHVSSVRSRVLNLCEVSADITVDLVKEALIRAGDGRPLEYEQDDQKIERLMRFYAGDEWIYGGVR